MGDKPPNPSYTPPSPPSRSNLPMLYYGLVVVVTAFIILAIYNLIIIKWCTDHHRRSRRRETRTQDLQISRSFDNPNRNLVSSFRYRKEGVTQGEGNDYECPVCLSVFEEDEEVRQLPSCKHYFHAQCIDMWLYSHRDCPLCRSPVLQRHVVTIHQEDARDGLLVSGIVF
ncbi:unnamed protein product [Ilex paraguariensis]|uniref:RING-type E3 ubiquitin transferase n=1 Tax=Ilex paraguariensis TaxID=185542 RepID=A0ABC8RKT9_9AQUA